MGSILWIIMYFMLLGGPIASIVWLCSSWSKYKSTVPFTPEHDKQKTRVIVAAVVAGVIMTVFLTIMAIYGVTVFFA